MCVCVCVYFFPPRFETLFPLYGKSTAPRVSRSWGSTVDMRAQRLRDLGFLVLKCDNRGSFRRCVCMCICICTRKSIPRLCCVLVQLVNRTACAVILGYLGFRGSRVGRGTAAMVSFFMWSVWRCCALPAYPAFCCLFLTDMLLCCAALRRRSFVVCCFYCCPTQTSNLSLAASFSFTLPDPFFVALPSPPPLPSPPLVV